MNFLLLLISGFVSAFGFLLCKKASSDKFNPFSFALAFQFWNLVIAAPLMLIGFGIPTDPLWWLVMFASAALFTLSMALNFKTFETTDASVVSLIARLSIITASVLGIILTKEVINLQVFFALILVILGTSTVCFEGKKFKITRGIIAAFAYAIIYGIVAFIDKQAINHFSPFTYPFFNNLVTIILMSVVAKTRTEAIKITLTKPVIILAGMLNLVSWATYLFALQNNDISRAFPIWDSTILLSVMILGFIFLSERKYLLQKIIGTALTIGGVFLLG
ncbi:EamA family transporter [Candidatus Microgenomates bacterium]|nr:EamA family transporter [Candidatus Microgenomates bacterium]